MYHLTSKANKGLATHQGLDLMGCRLADEIYEWLLGICQETGNESTDIYLSIVGHSLGGLIAQFAINLLFPPADAPPLSEETKKSIRSLEEKTGIKITPCSFTTLCTPHLGARKPPAPNSFYSLLQNKVIMSTATMFLGKTGSELMLTDGPLEDSMIFKLSKPEYKRLENWTCTSFSCLWHDIPVGFTSAAFGDHPYVDASFDKSYLPPNTFVIHDYLSPSTKASGKEAVLEVRARFLFHF